MRWPHRPQPGGHERATAPAARPPRRRVRLALALITVLLPACAGRALPREAPEAGRAPVSGTSGFSVERDAFPFPNLVRALSPDRSPDFANYCIIMVRAAGQFFRFARFDPGLPPVADGEYDRLTRAVLAVPAWDPPRPAEHRLVIPGYADLRTFSGEREPMVKAAFGRQWWSMAHFRVWRVAWGQPAGHQRRLARELIAEIEGGRPAALMITSFPEPDYLNHAVLVYAYRRSGTALEFSAYDPNDPGGPLGLHFEPTSGAFWVDALPYGPAGRVRAFRIFGSRFL